MGFHCDMCGECCRNLKDMRFYDDLHGGDGICRYLDGNRCSIYANRPDKCNIDKAYELYFKSTMTRDEYYELNYKGCEKLKQKTKLRNTTATNSASED